MFTWFDKLIAGTWIVLMLAFGSMLALGDFGGVRMLQQQAGILVTKATKSSIWVTQQIRMGLIDSLQVRAGWEQWLFDMLTKAAIKLLKKLIQSFFSAIRKILYKLKDSINQAVSAISNSKIARDIMKVLNFRINVCEEIDKWVNQQMSSISFLKTGSIESTAQYAWNSAGDWFNKTLGWTQPQPAYAQDQNCEFRLFPTNGTTAQGAIKCITAVGCQAANTARAAAFAAGDECAKGNGAKCDEGFGKLQNSLNTLRAASAKIFDADSCSLLGLVASIRIKKDGTCQYSLGAIEIGQNVDSAFSTDKLKKIGFDAGEKAEGFATQDQIVKLEPESGKSLPAFIPAALANRGINLDQVTLTTTLPDTGSALSNTNFVKDVYVTTIVDKPKGDLGFTSAVAAINATNSAGGGDNADGIDQIIDKVIEELTSLALEFLDIIFNAVNTITCGVLNFQDFCNATTQLSSQVTKGAIQYFDNLKASIKGNKIGASELQNIKLGTYLDRDRKSA
ncbi:MAG: hypothetical protein H7230_00895 [Candidatus Parcubacteria bacterium]|nr:hypothetical protein [Candidatus Paceibacterota bacterium]